MWGAETAGRRQSARRARFRASEQRAPTCRAASPKSISALQHPKKGVRCDSPMLTPNAPPSPRLQSLFRLCDELLGRADKVETDRRCPSFIDWTRPNSECIALVISEMYDLHLID